jgi:hypothetical protein
MVSNVAPVSKSKHLNALDIQSNLTLSSTAWIHHRNDNPVCKRLGEWPCQFDLNRTVTYKLEIRFRACSGDSKVNRTSVQQHEFPTLFKCTNAGQYDRLKREQRQSDRHGGPLILLTP